METGLYPFLLAWLQALWWPFARVMAALAFAPIFGDANTPMRIRVGLALILTLVALPSVSGPTDVEPLSLTAVALTLEQIAIGAMMGLTLQIVAASLSVFGFLAASQTSLAMAMLNDPIHGASSDALTILAGMLGILLFFALDVHLLLAGVLSASFTAWPIGQAFDALALRGVALGMGWLFAAAFLLATPIIFGAMLVQLGFGFMTRVAPSINIFSLGFSLVTLFGLAILVFMLRHIPEFYRQLTLRSLDLLSQLMRGHGG